MYLVLETEPLICCTCFVLQFWILSELNAKPIVAVLSQELPRSLENAFPNENYTSYIGAAYVKYIEQAGARVVPVLINQTDEYYDTIFKSTNGLLIPGGAVSIVDSGP